MANDSSPSGVVKLLENLKDLHRVTLNSLDELERNGVTAVPLDNVRRIVESYMTIMLRMVSYFVVDSRVRDADDAAAPGGRPIARSAAILMVGVALGALITAALLLFALQ